MFKRNLVKPLLISGFSGILLASFTVVTLELTRSLPIDKRSCAIPVQAVPQPVPEPGEETERPGDKRDDAYYAKALADQKIWEDKMLKASGSLSNRTVGVSMPIAGGWTERGCRVLSGDVIAADIRTNNSNNLYTLSGSGVVYKCNSNGTNFLHLNKKFSFQGGKMIRHIPGTSRIVVVDDISCQYTDNDGSTWVKSNLANVQIQKGVMVNGTGSNKTILVLGKNITSSVDIMAIYRSSDNGATFTKVIDIPDSYIPGNFYYKKDFYDIWTSYDNTVTNSRVFVVQGNKVYEFNLSNNTLTTKTNINATAPEIGERYILTGNVNGGTTTLYVCKSRNVNGVRTGTFYKSTDVAGSWSLKGSLSETAFGANAFSCGLGSNSNTLYFGYINLKRSEDGGQGWSLIADWTAYYATMNNYSIPTSATAKVHADIAGVFCQKLSNGTEVQLICSDGGLYYSTDKGTSVTPYSQKDNGTSGHAISEVYATYTNPKDHKEVLIGTQDQGIQRNNDYTKAGIRWHQQLYGGDWANIVSTPAATADYSAWATCGGCKYVFYNNNVQNTPLMTSPYNNVNSQGLGFYFSDGGAGDAGRALDPRFFSVLAAHPTNPQMVYMAVKGGDGHDRIARLKFTPSATAGTQGSVSVENSFDFTMATSTGGAFIAAMAVSRADPRYKYVLLSEGSFYFNRNADENFGGGSWVKSSLINGPDWGGGIVSVSPSKVPASANEVYISGGGGYNRFPVWFSSNFGQTFANISNNNGLPNTGVGKVEQTQNGKYVFAATEVGPYVYVKADQWWYDLSTDGTTYEAPQVPYKNLEIVYGTASGEKSLVRYSTYGRGVWDFTISSTNIVSRESGGGGVQKGSQTQTEVPLENVQTWKLYPNPVQNTLNIEMPDGAGANIRFVISNTLGQVELEGTGKPNRHTLSVNVEKLKSGKYQIVLYPSNDKPKVLSFIVN
jgi:hypothetical protein